MTAAPLPGTPFEGRRRLDGYITRSTMGASSGLGMALFGVPFFGLGVLVLTVFVPIIRESDERDDTGLLWAIGVLALVSGAAMVVGGVAAALRKRAVERGILENPKEPWRADFAWGDGREGPDVATTRSWLRGIGVVLVMIAVLAPFNVWAWNTGGIVWVPVVVVDLVLLLVLGSAVMAVGRKLKYGQARVELDTFPFFLGGEVRVRFRAASVLRRCRPIIFTLRCVEEAFEGSGRKGDAIQVAAYELYAQELRVDDPRALLEDGALPIRFALPAEGQETWLGHRPPRYWELAVKGNAQGLDYAGRFLLPVYRRRAAVEAA